MNPNVGMNAKDYLMSLLAISAIVFFLWGIFKAIQLSYRGTPADMPNFLSQAIVVLGGIFATNLGAVIGVEVDQGTGIGFKALNFPEEAIMTFRMICAYFYVIVMLITAICWGILKFSNDPNKIVGTLPMLSQTLLGVFVGIIAVLVGS